MASTNPFTHGVAAAAELAGSDPAAAALVLAQAAALALNAWALAHRVSTDQLVAMRSAAPEAASSIAAMMMKPEIAARLQAGLELALYIEQHPDRFRWTAGTGPLPTSLPVGGIITPV